jgi:hypothetical protein
MRFGRRHGGLGVPLREPRLRRGHPAGTNITNVATATYELPSGGETSVDSNIVTLKVDELLDVSVASGRPRRRPDLARPHRPAADFTVTNGGNGAESFTLGTVANGGGDDFDPAVTSIVLDTNGNGAYDAGVDTVYVERRQRSAARSRPVAHGLRPLTIPAGAGDGHRGRVDLTAVAKTGSGAPGTSFAGLGQGGGDAVVGATGADAEDDGYYRVAAASVSFVKSATVADAFGGAATAPGSTITYTLAATVSGSGSLANLGSRLRSGRHDLQGRLDHPRRRRAHRLADADAGSFTGTAIAVGLGTVAAGTTRTITFQVKID